MRNEIENKFLNCFNRIMKFFLNTIFFTLVFDKTNVLHKKYAYNSSFFVKKISCSNKVPDNIYYD
jgi:hypothetical protein